VSFRNSRENAIVARLDSEPAMILQWSSPANGADSWSFYRFNPFVWDNARSAFVWQFRHDVVVATSIFTPRKFRFSSRATSLASTQLRTTSYRRGMLVSRSVRYRDRCCSCGREHAVCSRIYSHTGKKQGREGMRSLLVHTEGCFEMPLRLSSWRLWIRNVASWISSRHFATNIHSV